MYASSDALFQLVKTLQPEEHKAFQKTLRQSGKAKSNYLRFYSAIAKAEHYEEEKLKEELCISAGSFSAVKSQLNERLLTFLCEAKPSTVKKMHYWLDCVELLVSRKLFHEANAYIERVKKEAKRHSLLYLVLEANKWKRFILQYICHDNYEKAATELAEEILKTAEAVTLEYKVAGFYAFVFSKFPQNLNLRNKEFVASLEELKNHECFGLDGSNENLSFLSTCYLGMAKNFVYKFTGELEKAYEQEKIVWQLVQNDWEWFYKNKHDETLGSVVNYLEALSSTLHVEEFRQQMDFADTLVPLEKNRPVYLEGALKIYRLMDTFNTKGEAITIEDIQPLIQYYHSGNTDKYIELKRLYEAYIARGLYVLERYDEALSYHEKVIQEYGRNDARQDYYENALANRLLFLFTKEISQSFKRMDMNAFMSLVNQYVEHIRHKPKDHDYRFEYAFVDFFKAIKNKPEKESLLEELEKLRYKIDALFAEHTPFLSLVKLHFDFPLLLNRWKIQLIGSAI